MRRGLTAAARAASALGMAVTLVVAVPTTAVAWQSSRQAKCLNHANGYASNSHPGLTAEEEEEHGDWLYEQCAENDAAEAIAEEQGAMAPELFPNTADDRHAHPLHCMDLSDGRFGMHENHNSPNPPPDPNGPGGSAAVNIPGEFMYAYVNGKARFMVRYVVWTIDDRNGDPVTPVKINQQPTYQGTPQVAVAQINFTQAYVPTSVWVEMPDTMALANQIMGVLPGRSLAMRTWMASKCHDKRYPTVIPQVLIDHMENLGWLDAGAAEFAPRAVRFVANGDPNQASSWALTEVPVTLPPAGQIFTKNTYKWFFDSAVVYNGPDTLAPVLSTDHVPGTVFPGPAVTLSGAATDASAVDDVSVSIQNIGGDYLQSDGSFGPDAAVLAAALASPGASVTTWAITVNLPIDSYDLEVTGSDSSGNSSTLSDVDFTVDPAGPDIEAPLIDMDHDKDAQFEGPNVLITGWATDNSGIETVAVEIKDRVTKQFLQPDGSFGPVVALSAVVDDPSAIATTWSIAVVLPEAGYNIESFAYDAAGNVGENPTWKKFDVIAATGDTVSPAVATDHTDGAQLTGPSFTLTGTADDAFGVSEVVATVANSLGEFLHSDGSFGANAEELAATLGSPGEFATTWTLDLNLADGNYDLEVFARDVAGNEGIAPNADFVVAAPDAVVPSATVDHSPGQEFIVVPVILAGDAADNVGVVSVTITITDSSGEFLQPDGSFAAAPAELPTTLGSPGATESTWSITLTLPNDSYDLDVVARDPSGNEGAESNADFSVNAPDSTVPTVATSHGTGASFAGPSVTLQGSADDATGVVAVVVTIVNATGDFLQSDGSFDVAPAELQTSLGSPGATTTSWQLTVALSDGPYDLEVFARDAAANEGVAPNADFTVTSAPDTSSPTASVDHAKDTQFSGPDITITGIADDNVGVTSAQLKVKDRDTGQWLQADGSFAPGAVWHDAVVANPGTSSVTWSIDITLPDGRFNPVARAFDAAGNEGGQSAFLPFEVIGGGGGNDTAAPTTSFDHAKDEQFSGPTVVLSGVADDNVGVVSVQVKIKNRDTGLWLQSDGSFAASVQWHDAMVDPAGGATTAWSVEVDLPLGNFNPVSRAFDAAGNEGTQSAFLPIEVI